jgi:hypothetical protein
LVRIDKMESNITTIDDLHYELFEYIFAFLPKVDMRISASVSHKWSERIKQTQTYQSDEYKILIGYRYVYALAECGYLNVLKWILSMNQRIPKSINRQLYFAAISGGHLPVAVWLQGLGFKPKKRAHRRAICLGRTDILLQITPTDIIPAELGELIYTTAEYNNLDALKALLCRYATTSSTFFKDNQKKLLSVFTTALKNNSLLVADHCLQLIRDDNLPKAFSENRCCKILRSCNHETYTWLRGNMSRFPDDTLIWYILLNSVNFTLMTWLYDNPTESVNLRKFDLNLWKASALYCGVEKLQWLYDRGVRFDIDAYDRLIDNSLYSTDKLKWIYDKIGPDTRTATIDRVRRLNDVELAKWIHRHGFNCNMTAAFWNKRQWGYKVMYWLCDPTIHCFVDNESKCGKLNCHGPEILSEHIKRSIVDTYERMCSDHVKPDPDFLKLYELLF